MTRYCLIFFLLVCGSVRAQSFREAVISPADNGRVLSDVLAEMENLHGIEFICDEKEMQTYTINGIVEKERLTDFLKDYLVDFRLFKVSDEVMFIIHRSGSDHFALNDDNFLLFPERDDSLFTLRGSVVDGLSREPLINAKIFVRQTGATTVADENGKFHLGSLRREITEVDVEYVGYESNHYVIGFSRLGTAQELPAALMPVSHELESVTITAARVDENITAKITGVENLSIATIKTVPAFLGEVDPIRSLTSLPGVSTIGELASGFNVRGGEAGQNLVLQDGAILYNPSHLFGFFSAFNPDMVSNVTLYKGGGPAHFGSRISSVLDVSLRNGNPAKHTVTGGVGMVSSRLSFEGPITRNKSSYLIGGRISYCNWLVHATDNIGLRNSGANFSDVTGKIFQTINGKNFVTVTGYHSYDDFKLATDSVFSWNTTNVSLKWDHTFQENVFSTLTAMSSNYFSQVHSISQIEGFRYKNAIRSLGFKYDISRVVNEGSKLLWGVESTATTMEPGKLTPDDQFDNVSAADMQDQRSLETAVYFEWSKDLTKKWAIAAGVRYSHFLRLGKEDIYTFDYDHYAGRYPEILDTVSYASGETIKHYSGLEPRISLSFLISSFSSLKASYYRGYQYLHLISNTSSSTPQDYWVTSGPYLKPQIGDQYSLGFFKDVDEHRYQLSLEGFYKNINNAVDYIEGADITLNPALEAGLAQGQGQAYGAELLVKRPAGRVNGWLAYTYSRSLRRFAGTREVLTINHGNYYPSTFDQPHHFSLILNYQLGIRSSLSANFNYSTGRPITIPVSKFSYAAYLSVLNYSERNDYRLDDYHRLDLSLTIRNKPRSNERLKSEWVISVFNVYGRKNTYSVSFNRFGTASKMSVLGSIFPSVSYNFRF
jgi:hypothetical protein